MTVRKAHTKQSKWAILERKVSLLPDRPRLKKPGRFLAFQVSMEVL
jgi:hypothetical protein